MSSKGPIAVLGAGGPTGTECIKRLAELGIVARAVVRTPYKYREKLQAIDPKVEIVAGDVTEPDSLAAALHGTRGAIFAAKGQTFFSASSVDKQGVVNVATAGKAAGLERVVLVSSALVNPKNRLHPIRILLNNIRWSSMDSKFAGEQLLRQSGVSYTVVRPGRLTNAKGGEHLVIAEQGDKGSAGWISRADVAAVCVEAVLNPAAAGLTVECKEDPEQAATQDSIQKLFAGLTGD